MKWSLWLALQAEIMGFAWLATRLLGLLVATVVFMVLAIVAKAIRA